MKIKAVEKRIGLSSKTVRFYEEKGLLSIQRDTSGYRDYCEEDIQELLQIKLLRKCGLTIQQLIALHHDKIQLEDLLYQRISELDKNNFEISDQKDLCSEVIKAKGEYHKLYEHVNNLESDEYKALIECIIEEERPSLGMQILRTLPLLAPVLHTLLFLTTKQYEYLGIGFSFSLIATVIITISWHNFLKVYQFQKESFWEGIKHFLGLLMLLFLLVIGVLSFFSLVNQLQTVIFMKDSIFIMSIPRISAMPMMVLGLEIVLILGIFIGQKIYTSRISSISFFTTFC